jgi:four helix bundle protein
MAGVRRYEDLFTWQLADQFKREVHRLVSSSSRAAGNFRYRDQLVEAAADASKDICEGFLRCSPLVFANFLDYALGSLVEAEGRLRDGVERGYFGTEDCQEAFRLAKRCCRAALRLKQSQVKYASERRKPKKR